MENHEPDPPLRQHSGDEQFETVLVAWYPSAFEAEFQGGQLEAAGIDCFISNSHGNSMLPTIETRVGLSVRKENYVRAVAVLTDRSEEEVEEELLVLRENELAASREKESFQSSENEFSGSKNGWAAESDKSWNWDSILKMLLFGLLIWEIWRRFF